MYICIKNVNMPSVSESKKAKLMQAGQELFWKYGIRRVTVEDICNAAGVSRMTFYKYFPNKIHLAIRILEDIFRQSRLKYRKAMDSRGSFDRKIEAIIRLKIEVSRDLSTEFLQEIYQSGDPELIRFVREWTEKTMEMVFHDFEVARKNGEIRSDIRADVLLYLVNHLTCLVTDEKFAALYQHPSEMIKDLSEYFFYGIMPRRKHR